jgi:hypothetical protein
VFLPSPTLVWVVGFNNMLSKTYNFFTLIFCIGKADHIMWSHLKKKMHQFCTSQRQQCFLNSVAGLNKTPILHQSLFKGFNSHMSFL